jgi:hypothetical protein
LRLVVAVAVAVPVISVCDDDEKTILDIGGELGSYL